MEAHERAPGTPLWSRRQILVSVALACTAGAFAQGQGAGPVAAARRLIAATPESRRGALLLRFTEDARSDWNYTPRRRDGITWKTMDAAQREAMTGLLLSALNDRGVDKVRALMALEITLRELESSSASYRDPDNYAVALYGTPGESGWGWRFEGHHLSLHFSLDGDRYMASLPQFFGANPAEVPRDVAGGPKAGFRLLGAEEDLAREWLGSLNPAQRRQAVFDSRPYGDIISRNAERAQPLDEVGLAWEAMDAGQQARALKLIAVFAEHLQPELAEARLLRVRNAPLASIRIGWAGSTSPRKPHYFRIQGTSFLIEYDNSGGNHVHSVWRDFEGDFGRDVLREHYRRAAESGHRHGVR
jgi:hypothetical protein